MNIKEIILHSNGEKIMDTIDNPTANDDILVLDTASGLVQKESEKKPVPRLDNVIKQVIEKAKSETILGQREGIYPDKILIIEGKPFKVKAIRKKDLVLRLITDEKEITRLHNRTKPKETVAM